MEGFPLTEENLPSNWIRRLCALLAVPATPETISLLWAWQRVGKFPLGRGIPNEAFVLGMTGVVLESSYPGIMESMRDGTKTAKEIVLENMEEFSQWGTGAWPILKVLGS